MVSRTQKFSIQIYLWNKIKISCSWNKKPFKTILSKQVTYLLRNETTSHRPINNTEEFRKNGHWKAYVTLWSLVQSFLVSHPVVLDVNHSFHRLMPTPGNNWCFVDDEMIPSGLSTLVSTAFDSVNSYGWFLTQLSVHYYLRGGNQDDPRVVHVNTHQWFWYRQEM